MKVFYWSPFFTKIATITAVINSAKSLLKYNKKNKYSVSIINAIGEWNDYKKTINENIDFKDLSKKNYTGLIPRGGFLKSRFSYIFIFIFSLPKLLRLINSEKPDYLVIHLITSLPIFLSLFFNKKTKIILRLSGLPKLNPLRLVLWKLFAKKIYKVTCPTESTLKTINEHKIFDERKIYLLKDPIISIKDIIKLKNEKLNIDIAKNKYILGIGRLTTQKNFELLIKFYIKLIKEYPEYKLYILGDGEDRIMLNSLIQKHQLNKKVFLLGHKNNIFKYLKHADCFILSSLWEDPGFVIVEAIFCNVPVLSSNCSSGPKEIIGSDKGILFENNSKEDFIRKFYQFRNLNANKKNSYVYNAKKFIKRFTLLSHYNELKKLIV